MSSTPSPSLPGVLNVFTTVLGCCVSSAVNFAFFTVFRRKCYALYANTDAGTGHSVSSSLNVRFQLSENVRTSGMLARISLMCFCLDVSESAVSG